MRAPRAARKKSPPKQIKDPRQAEASKRVWEEPGYREWKSNWARHNNKKKREAGWRHIGRVGVPDGMRKPEALAIMADATAKAERIYAKMAEAGIVEPLDADKVPVTESEMASAALKQAMVFVLSSTVNTKERMTAIRTVLDFTKAKPAQKIDAKFSNAEAWLEEVAADVAVNGNAQ